MQETTDLLNEWNSSHEKFWAERGDIDERRNHCCSSRR